MNYLECCIDVSSRRATNCLLTDWLLFRTRKLSSKRNERNRSENKNRENQLLDGDGSNIPVDSTFMDRQEVVFVQTIWQWLIVSAGLQHFTEDMTHANTHACFSCDWYAAKSVCVCVRKPVSHHFISNPNACGGSTVYQEGVSSCVCICAFKSHCKLKWTTAQEDSKS